MCRGGPAGALAHRLREKLGQRHPRGRERAEELSLSRGEIVLADGSRRPRMVGSSVANS